MDEATALRDWHRLFGLLLTDLFTDSPFVVEIERDLSQQQQFLDVVVVRRHRGAFAERLPDGLDDLTAHNLITFKSHRETLDDWAMKELIGHYVAYRKLVNRSPSELLGEDEFHLYAVCARYPHNLSGQVPWRERQAGVYDCSWGTDTVRVVIAGQLPREAHNAPLHLFGTAPELVRFGQGAYRQHSEVTSLLLTQLFEGFQGEEFSMSYTMADFKRDFFRERLARLTPEEQRDVLASLSPDVLALLPPEMFRSLPSEVFQTLPLEQRLAGLSEDQLRQYLEQRTSARSTKKRKPRKKE